MSGHGAPPQRHCALPTLRPAGGNAAAALSARRRPPQKPDGSDSGAALRGAPRSAERPIAAASRRKRAPHPIILLPCLLDLPCPSAPPASLAEGGQRRAQTRQSQHGQGMPTRPGSPKAPRGPPKAAAGNMLMRSTVCRRCAAANETALQKKEDTSEKGALSRKFQMLNAYIF